MSQGHLYSQSKYTTLGNHVFMLLIDNLNYI